MARIPKSAKQSSNPNKTDKPTHPAYNNFPGFIN
jgi:hypothetical protein